MSLQEKCAALASQYFSDDVDKAREFVESDIVTNGPRPEGVDFLTHYGARAAKFGKHGHRHSGSGKDASPDEKKRKMAHLLKHSKHSRSGLFDDPSASADSLEEAKLNEMMNRLKLVASIDPEDLVPERPEGRGPSYSHHKKNKMRCGEYGQDSESQDAEQALEAALAVARKAATDPENAQKYYDEGREILKSAATESAASRSSEFESREGLVSWAKKKMGLGSKKDKDKKKDKHDDDDDKYEYTLTKKKKARSAQFGKTHVMVRKGESYDPETEHPFFVDDDDPRKQARSAAYNDDEFDEISMDEIIKSYEKAHQTPADAARASQGGFRGGAYDSETPEERDRLFDSLKRAAGSLANAAGKSADVTLLMRVARPNDRLSDAAASLTESVQTLVQAHSEGKDVRDILKMSNFGEEKFERDFSSNNPSDQPLERALMKVQIYKKGSSTPSEYSGKVSVQTAATFHIRWAEKPAGGGAQLVNLTDCRFSAPVPWSVFFSDKEEFAWDKLSKFVRFYVGKPPAEDPEVYTLQQKVFDLELDSATKTAFEKSIKNKNPFVLVSNDFVVNDSGKSTRAVALLPFDKEGQFEHVWFLRA